MISEKGLSKDERIFSKFRTSDFFPISQVLEEMWQYNLLGVNLRYSAFKIKWISEIRSNIWKVMVLGKGLRKNTRNFAKLRTSDFLPITRTFEEVCFWYLQSTQWERCSLQIKRKLKIGIYTKKVMATRVGLRKNSKKIFKNELLWFLVIS